GGIDPRDARVESGSHRVQDLVLRGTPSPLLPACFPAAEPEDGDVRSPRTQPPQLHRGPPLTRVPRVGRPTGAETAGAHGPRTGGVASRSGAGGGPRRSTPRG